MPKITQDLLNIVFYLYESAEDARADRRPRGSGFLLNYRKCYYGVTNWHVACGGGASVIGLRTPVGVEVVELDPSDWTSNVLEADIAVVRLNLSGDKFFRRAVYEHSLARRGLYGIGVGDDVFMLGLFVDQMGKPDGPPMARFGNISMLADAEYPVVTGDRRYEGFIVDMRSRGGFSGSPVFTYRTFGSDLASFGAERVEIDLSGLNVTNGRGMRNERVQARVKVDSKLHLLGVHYAQFQEPMTLTGLEPLSGLHGQESRQLVTSKTEVVGASGMTCVAPAWKIVDLLESPLLAQERKDNPPVDRRTG